MSDLRPISEKIEQFVQDEAKELLTNCTPEQQAFAQRIIDSYPKGKPVDWRSMHDLAVRTLRKNG